MKLLPVLVSAGALFLATQALAAKQLECPAPSSITSHAKFEQAFKPFNGDFWLLTTPSFSANNTDWNIIFGGDFPNAKDAAAALVEGDKAFKTEVTLSEPVQKTQDEYLICIYTAQGSGYFVGAVNPPLTDIPPDYLLKFKK